MGIKTLHERFSEEEMKRLLKKKIELGLNWHDFVMLLADLNEAK